MLLLEGLPRNKYLTKSEFHKKYPIKGQPFCTTCYQLYPPILPGLAHWLWRRCFPTGFTKAIVFSTSIPFMLRRRCFPCDFTRALFCILFLETCGWLLFLKRGLIACFCHTFLTYNQLGGYDHSVLDTFVQLTEGRSARDLPKQPPAKKNLWGLRPPQYAFAFCCCFKPLRRACAAVALRGFATLPLL